MPEEITNTAASSNKNTINSNSSSSSGNIQEASPRSLKSRVGATWYLLFWILANSLVWTTAVLYLKFSDPRYTSTLAMNVSFGGDSTNISVPGIGQASSWSESTYRSFADPRASYERLIQSSQVLETAAQRLGVTPEEFGSPRVKIVDNTTLMEIQFKGDTPLQAQTKVTALYEVLEEKLQELRRAETEQQNRDLESAVSYDAQRLQAAQQRLYNYKAQSPLNSSNQLPSVTSSLESLQLQRSENQVNLQQISANIKQLSLNLGLSAQDAADALKLQADQTFQKYLVNYSQASAELVAVSAQFLPNSPQFQVKQAEREMIQRVLLDQSNALLGRSVSLGTLDLFLADSSSSSTERSELFQRLISAYAEYQGVAASIQELNQQISLFQSRLRTLSQEQTRLDDIERDVKIAETVFSSNLTRQNLNRSNGSSTYPPISIVIQPDLAKKPSEPRPLLVVAGAFMSTLLLTSGTLTLWLRNRKYYEL